jgi:hypothetical protein
VGLVKLLSNAGSDLSELLIDAGTDLSESLRAGLDGVRCSGCDRLRQRSEDRDDLFHGGRDLP